MTITGNTESRSRLGFESRDEFEFHELANLFPLLEGDRQQELVASIRANGQREAIALFDGKIIDGRNRYRAAREAKIPPRFVTLSPDTDALKYVLDKNLHRRHLDESQRSMVAAKITNMRQGERTDLERSANLQKVDRASAAKLMNVSERTAASAAKVCADGTPELVKAVEAGEVAVSAAAEFAKQPTSDQAAQIKEHGGAKIAVMKNRDPKKPKTTKKASLAQTLVPDWKAMVEAAIGLAGAAQVAELAVHQMPENLQYEFADRIMRRLDQAHPAAAVEPKADDTTKAA